MQQLTPPLNRSIAFGSVVPKPWLTMYDLPSEDPEEPGLPDEYHDLQPDFLSSALWLRQYDPKQRFTGTDLNLYYDQNHPQWYKRPDWFLAVGVTRLYDGHDLRLSYVVWDEQVSPAVVVESLSPGTEREDLGPFYCETDAIVEGEPQELEVCDEDGEDSAGDEGISDRIDGGSASLPLKGTPSPKAKPPKKWEVYETILKVPHYVVFSRYTNRVRYFRLIQGRYEEQRLDTDNPRLWLGDLEIGLGLWSGTYKGANRAWLRWFGEDGEWLLTESEREARRADEAEAALAEERRFRQRLLEQLRQKGIDLDLDEL